MIPREELYIALSLAVAAASAPQGKETPLPGMGPGRLGLDTIGFDFRINGDLHIAGTNGRRLAVTVLQLSANPSLCGKFAVPLDKAAGLMLTFAPTPTSPPSTISFCLFGTDQLFLTCSDGEAAMVERAQSPFPDYTAMLNSNSEPTKDAVYDAHTLAWALSQLAPLAESGLAWHIPAHGATTLRPQLRQFKCIREVIVALKPFHTW